MAITNDTTNNAFPYPTAANDGDDFAAGVQEFAEATDNMWSSGDLVDRPSTGLVVNQVYFAEDTNTLYVYTGSLWEGLAPATQMQQAQCTVTLGLPYGSNQAITGCSVTAPSAGVYLVTASFDFQGTSTGWGDAVGLCLHSGTALSAQAILGDNGNNVSRTTVSQFWAPTCAAGDTISLAATKTGNGGDVQFNLGLTILTVLRVA